MKVVKMVARPEEVEDANLDVQTNAKIIRKQINAMEEEMGLDLSDPENIDYEKKYNKARKSIRKYLAYTVVVASGLPMDDYFDIISKKKMKQIKKLKPKALLNKSPLFANGKRGRDFKDPLFKRQYYCLLVTYIVNSFDELIEGQIIYNEDKISRDEKRIVYLSKLFNAIIGFSIKLFDNLDYSPELLKLFELITLRNCQDENGQKRNYYDRKKDLLVKHVKGSCKNVKGIFIGDGIYTNELVKLAYMISTNNFKIAGEVVADLDARAEDPENEGLINALGYCAVQFWDGDGERPMFIDAFLRCCPKMYYKFRKIKTDPYTNYGCKLMSFVDFMLNDKEVHHHMNRLLRKPLFFGIFGPLYWY